MVLAQKRAHPSIEDVSRYWDAQPCNIRHSALPVGTREYFDEVEARKYLVEPHIPAFADFHRWRGKRVLEIGCGIGTDTISFARAGAWVTAIDISNASLALAHRRAAVFGFTDRIDFRAGNAEQLSDVVTPEPYDLVYSYGVIHHAPDPSKVVHQIGRFVSQTSIVKIMIYHRVSWKVLSIIATKGGFRFWELNRIVAEHSEAQNGCPVTYTYTRSQGERLLESAGFRVTAARVQHIFPYRVRDYTRYRYVRAWPFSRLPRPLFHALESRLGWHLCLTAEPGRTLTGTGWHA
jgi:2-polyprenyl-3-methyl-5-hydroxy-6-metoxy-1,4-benzoquinol methylase